MPTPHDLGITLNLPRPAAAESISSQSKSALMAAHNQGVLTYRQALTNPAAFAAWAAEAPALAIPGNTSTVHYLVYLNTSTQQGMPYLIEEGNVAAFVRAHHALTVAAAEGLVHYLQPVTPARPGADQILEQQFGGDSAVPNRGAHTDMRYETCFIVRVQDRPVLVACRDVATFVYDQWALTRAQQLNVLTYGGVADVGRASDMGWLLDQVGEGAELPADDGTSHYLHYLVDVNPSRWAVLVPFGDAPKTVFGLALGQAHPDASELAYSKGLLPT